MKLMDIQVVDFIKTLREIIDEHSLSEDQKEKLKMLVVGFAAGCESERKTA